VSGVHGDGASRLLVTAARLLPASRREWGAAMRAELAAIQPRGSRWHFALGCLLATVRFDVLRRAGYPLLMAGTLVTAVVWTRRIQYTPLHFGLLAFVSVLLVVAWLGRRPGPLGPVAPGWMARGVRAGTFALIGTMAAGVVVSMAGHGNPDEQAQSGVPAFTVLLTSYLLGVLTLTARRSAATERVLTAGVVAGGGAATAWTLLAVLSPPIPAGIGTTVLLIMAAMLAGAAGAGPKGRALGALCAGPTAALLIVLAVVLLSSYGPAVMIPDLAPAALTPADDLAQSRSEIQDPYVAVLALGCILAWLQSVASLATRTALRAEILSR
jgi:hypothetical protein